MDLKTAGAAPTDIEREAVASVLGAAEAERDPVGLHVRRGGAASVTACSTCSTP